MTVADLIKKLQAVENPDRIVVLASVATDRVKSRMEFMLGSYQKRKRRCGLESLTAKDKALGYTKADVVKGKPAFIIFT